MTITRLKTKNQITIPKEIAKRLNLKVDELLSVEVENNYIKLIPVEVEPRYTEEEIKAIDHIVDKEKARTKLIKPGRQFSRYIKKTTG